MFGQKLTAACLASVVMFVGCSSHRVSPPAPRPLGEDFQAYTAPRNPQAEDLKPAQAVEPEGELQFKDALALSLLHSPKLSAMAWSVRVKEAEAVQAGLRPNPELEFELEEFGGEGPRREFDSAEASVVLSQVIELGGKRGARRRIGQAERTLAGYDYEAERLAVLTDATLGFIDVLAAQQQLELAVDLSRLSEETQETVAQRVRAGKVSPLEKTKAAIELANRRIEADRAAGSLKIARQHLAAGWGGDNPRFARAVGRIDRVGDIPPLETLQALIQTNPEVARWAGEMEFHMAQLALERSKRMFDLTISAGVKRFEETEDYAYTMGLSLPIPLFDRNQGQVRAARYRVTRAEHQARAAQARIAAALLESYEALVNARSEALTLEREVIPAAGQAFEAARQGYRQGKFGYLEVLDAQRTYAEMNARLIDARANYHRAVALVESLVGTRLSSLIENGTPKREEKP